MARKFKSKSESESAPKPEPAREPTPSSSSSASDSESDYSSDDTVEDEDGTELTPAMDAAILQTLARIRNKEGVYSGENILQKALKDAEEKAAARGLTKLQAKKEEKPFLLKDLHRANLLAGVQPESDDEEEQEPLTNVEAEAKARKEALSAFHALADDDDDDEDGFLVKREKEAEEIADEDAAYRSFLLEMGGGEEQVRRALGIADAPVTDYREDVESDADAEDEDDKEDKAAAKKEKKAKKEKLSAEAKEQKEKERRAKRAQADEDFLMDYILNRGWIEKDKKDVPTYEEIVGRAKSESGDESSDESEAGEHPWGKLEDEDEFDEVAEEFEHTYNFRFEEPGAASIVTHPRQIDSLVRREDDKRKTKREERAERKAAEKAAKEEETKRLKGAKRREMETMLESLKEELGDYVDWDQVEKIMDGDFDEEEWERVVTAMLQAKADREEGIPDDEEKPTWDDDLGDYGDGDEEAGDGWVEPTRWEDTEEYAAAGEDDEDEDAPFNMDADYIGLEDEPSKKKSKKDKKARKAEKRAAEAAAAAGDLTFEQRAEKLKEAATELNKLQGEDMIGDLRTRFKYTKSAPVSFGLTPAEILMASDAELNEVVSVKMLAPYRRGGLGIAGRGLGKRVRELKSRVAQRKWGEDMPVDNKKKGNKAAVGGGGANATPLGEKKDSEGEGRKGKRLGKKERMKKLKATGGDAVAAPATAVVEPVAGAKRKREDEPAPAPAAPAAAASGDGEGKKKRRKKKKGGDKE